MTAPESTPRGRGRPQTHGITRLREAVNTLGSRVIDRRTGVGRALAQWRAELVDDLGGPDVVTVQQRAIVDLCVREKLMVDSIDTWVLTQPSLINKRKKAVLPIVQQRTQIADALARHLAMLGLDRRAKPAQSLTGYIEQRYGAQDGHDERDAERGTDPSAPLATVEPEPTTPRREPSRTRRTPIPRDPRGTSTPSKETPTC